MRVSRRGLCIQCLALVLSVNACVCITSMVNITDAAESLQTSQRQRLPLDEKNTKRKALRERNPFKVLTKMWTAHQRNTSNLPSSPVTCNTSSCTNVESWERNIFELIPGRLFYSVHSSISVTQSEIAEHKKAGSNKFFFSTYFHEDYLPFCLDFGPVDLGVVHNFCSRMRDFWCHEKLRDRELVYYTEDTHQNRTNSAFLLAAFMVLDLKYSAEDAWAPFERMPTNTFSTFRDATFCEQTYHLTVLDCLKGLKKATSLGWYSPREFCPYSYKSLEECMDGHMISPKFLAFRGPVDANMWSIPCAQDAQQDVDYHPDHFVDYFNELGVTCVIRLNEEDTYDRKAYTDKGIKHHDMYFDDCTVPSTSVIQRFIEIAEKEPGMLAVHCRAGLGRTGTLIACYFIKQHDFTAPEAIGWLRIVRPGSVIGPQQHFLHSYEDTCHCPMLGVGRACATEGAKSIVHQSAFDEHYIVDDPISYNPKMVGEIVAQAQVRRMKHAETLSN